MVVVNGLELPALLVAGIESGDWPPQVSIDVLNTVFPEEAKWPEFFSLDGIVGINESFWAKETRLVYVGFPGEEGSVRVDRTVIIGELDTEKAIALRYSSVDDQQPDVVCLTDRPGAYWVQVASSFDELLQRLGVPIGGS